MKHDNYLYHRLNSHSYNKLQKIAIKKKVIRKHDKHVYSRKKLLNRILKFYYNKVRIIERFYMQSVKKILIKSQLQFINDETILGDPVINIPKIFKYSFKLYAFDIRELYKIITIKNINPYTNNQFPYYVKTRVFNIITYLKHNKISIDFENTIPLESIISVKMTNFLTILSDLQTYPNIEIFLNYTPQQLFYYMKYIRLNNLIREKFVFSMYSDIKRHYIQYDNIKFKLELINSLLIVININDNYQHTRALILSNALVSNIQQYYYYDRHDINTSEIVYNNTSEIIYNNTSEIVYNNTSEIVYNNTSEIVYNNISDIVYNNISDIVYNNTSEIVYNNTSEIVYNNTNVLNPVLSFQSNLDIIFY
jgi:hypothetical protein